MERVARLGQSPEAVEYRNLRVAWKGYNTVAVYTVNGDVGYQREMLVRPPAAVVLPVDFRRRELYLNAELRPHRAFGCLPEAQAFLQELPRDTFLPPERFFTVPADDVRIFEACAGLLETDADGRPVESPKQAAVRELLEESGLSVDEDRLKHVMDCLPTIGSSNERSHLFLADLPSDHRETRVQPRGDGSEEIDVYRMSFDEAFHLLDEGRIEGSSTALLLMHLRLHELRAR